MPGPGRWLRCARSMAITGLCSSSVITPRTKMSGVGLLKYIRSPIAVILYLNISINEPIQATSNFQNQGLDSIMHAPIIWHYFFSVPAVFQKTLDCFGRPDVVVHNAGIIHEYDWEKCLAVNIVRINTCYLHWSRNTVCYRMIHLMYLYGIFEFRLSIPSPLLLSDNP